jgi:aldehyde dehydrogenase (NAD+)
MDKILNAVDLQTKVANSKELINVSKRIELLLKLKEVINDNEVEIVEALKSDLGKSEFESYISEIDFVTHEIDLALKNIHKWSKPKKVRSSLTFFPVKSYIYSEPYGKALIISPWNYPFQLLLDPLVGALAAGNTAILKPSEMAPATAAIVEKIISKAFDPKYVAVVTGAVEETTMLLEQKFDYIFYTGNGHVARIVMAAAAKNLTPLTLELGGKSPCLVLSENIDLSAKRIVWGKFFNAGQTCVAPDYVLIRPQDKQTFVESCKKWIEYFYGKDQRNCPDYGRIINERHFDRLCSYIEKDDLLHGGDVDKSQKYISPTLLSATEESKVMSEEIFGPLLPIVEINDLNDAIQYVLKGDKPLASYAFLDSESDKNEFIAKVSSGGMVINDTIVHLSNPNLPFGGVGESGMGGYHGKHSFDIFSHKKSVMKRSFLFENSLRYPPYKGKLDLIRKILSMF